MTVPFFVTIPHSGEKVPSQTPWLAKLPEPILMCDVDRYVDQLYMPSLTRLGVPWIKTDWHRYAADLNRVPQDIDAGSVEGSANPVGTHSRGFHWTITTTEQVLQPQPMSEATHQELVQLIYEPFHRQVREKYHEFKLRGHHQVYHLYAHSMPSLGTRQHRDPGELRAEIVVSDCHGKSCDRPYRDLVIAAYVTAGFKVGYNWPYFGGRVSEQYGLPQQGQQAIQVELNRSLYMDENSKKLLPDKAEAVQKKLQLALTYIRDGLQSF